MPSNILKIATNKMFTKCTVLPRVHRKRATGQGNMGWGGGGDRFLLKFKSFQCIIFDYNNNSGQVYLFENNSTSRA